MTIGPYQRRSKDADILKWRGIHTGEQCAIIANGPSVRGLDLSAIECTTIGVNRAWMLRDWDYYAMGDLRQFEDYEKARGPITELEPLFTLETGPRHATRLLNLPSKSRQFSFDLVSGVYPNNTITATAIQLAVWMGFKDIYLVGVDANGAHFHDEKEVPPKKFANQREAYGYIAGILDGKGVRITNLNPQSHVFAFPRRLFSEVFPS